MALTDSILKNAQDLQVGDMKFNGSKKLAVTCTETKKCLQLDVTEVMLRLIRCSLM